jgi:hypothetical protein
MIQLDTGNPLFWTIFRVFPRHRQEQEWQGLAAVRQEGRRLFVEFF